MRHQVKYNLADTAARRSAFTLVEMLVAVALVLLMMSLFAEVFTLATGTMSRQKGLSENDQRARMVATLLGSDFRKRSFRDVVPFVTGTSQASLDLEPAELKRGYFQYSENDPDNDTDDVLRLTIDTTQNQQDIGRDVSLDGNPELDVARDDFLLYGRASELPGGLAANPNQPEGDDGVFSNANGAAQSTAAEVVWFLRGGNLYRRMMLIRKPYRSDIPAGAEFDPTTSNPPSSTSIITTDFPSFWNDFDFSVFFNGALGHVQFHNENSLINTTSAGALNIGPLLNVPISLGIPPLRFGHSPNASSFAPREFDSSGNFIGSFTHEETSNANFKYPGVAVTNSDDPHTMSVTLNAANNSVNEFANGPRIGEDLLLSNVVSFDIKIWDQGVGNGPDGQPGFAGVDDDMDGNPDNPSETGGLHRWDSQFRGAISDDGSFVDLGHAINSGYYHRASGNQNGTNTGYGNRFDTWHPLAQLSDPPPYIAAMYVPVGSQLATNRPSRARPAWVPNNAYGVNDIILPTNPTSQGLRVAYRCVSNSGLSGITEPIWNENKFGLTTEPNGPVWEAIPNLLPVRAMQIKIRYLDVSSGLLKDLTLVESLRDDM